MNCVQSPSIPQVGGLFASMEARHGHDRSSSPRPSIPDSLQDASHALDRLIHDALLPYRGRHDDRLADLEERARAIAASIVAPFERKQAPSAPPLDLRTQGTKSEAWF